MLADLIPDSTPDSTVLKILMLLIHKCTTDWANSRGLIPDFQNGFREGYRMNNNPFVLRCVKEWACANRLTLYVAAVDATNAFPSTDHPTLWLKLLRVGMGGAIFDWLRMLYQRMEYYVRHILRTTSSPRSWRGMEVMLKNGSQYVVSIVRVGTALLVAERTSWRDPPSLGPPVENHAVLCNINGLPPILAHATHITAQTRLITSDEFLVRTVILQSLLDRARLTRYGPSGLLGKPRVYLSRWDKSGPSAEFVEESRARRGPM
ncbi:hypothetical protein B0H10DRAFT_1847662 [Mycena sp. CBHHK59/15]|nr:hypothetical protein B0H10DRAFT_1847662 [Mycena sp. CBHHK59/15]